MQRIVRVVEKKVHRIIAGRDEGGNADRDRDRRATFGEFKCRNNGGKTVHYAFGSREFRMRENHGERRLAGAYQNIITASQDPAERNEQAGIVAVRLHERERQPGAGLRGMAPLFLHGLYERLGVVGDGAFRQAPSIRGSTREPYLASRRGSTSGEAPAMTSQSTNSISPN